MKAIFINVRYKEVTIIDTEDDIKEWYKLLECEMLQAVHLMNDQLLWVDEEALLHKESLPGAFMLFNNVYGGHGLITGDDYEGDVTDTTIKPEDLPMLMSVIKFIPVDLLPEPGFFIQSF